MWKGIESPSGEKGPNGYQGNVYWANGVEGSNVCQGKWEHVVICVNNLCQNYNNSVYIYYLFE